MASFEPALPDTMYEGKVFGKLGSYLGDIKSNCGRYAFFPVNGHGLNVCSETLREIADSLDFLNDGRKA